MPPKKHPFCHMTLNLVHTKEQFDSIVSDSPKHQAKITQNIGSQKDLIIPRCGKIPNYEELSSKGCSRKDVLKSGYQRLRQSKNLPNVQTYELTERDWSMINILKEKFGSKIQVDVEWNEIFVLLIKKFEEFYHIDSEKTLSKSLKLPEIFTNQIISEEIIKDLFNYWRSTKTQINWYPLARKYWSRSQHNLDPIVIPFRPRKFDNIKRKFVRNKIKKGKLALEQQRRKGELSLQRLNGMRDDQNDRNEKFELSVSRFHEIVKKIVPKADKKEVNTKGTVNLNNDDQTEGINKTASQAQIPQPSKFLFKNIEKLTSSSHPQFYRMLIKRFQMNFRSLMLRIQSKFRKRTLPVWISVDEPEFCEGSAQVSEIGQRQFRNSLLVEGLEQLRRFLKEEEEVSQGTAKDQTGGKQGESEAMIDKERNRSQIEEIEQDDGEWDSNTGVILQQLTGECKNVYDCEDTILQSTSTYESQSLTTNSQSQSYQLKYTS